MFFYNYTCIRRRRGGSGKSYIEKYLKSIRQWRHAGGYGDIMVTDGFNLYLYGDTL